MHPFAFLRFLLISSLSILFIACSQLEQTNKQQSIDIVRFNGIDGLFNVSTDYVYFGQFEDDAQTLTAPVSDGDVLMISMEDYAFYYRYSKEKGDMLSFVVDTLDHWLYDDEGNVLAALLPGDTIHEEKLAQISTEKLKDLNILVITDSLNSAQLDFVEKIRKSGVHPGLVADENLEGYSIDEILLKLQPSWLALSSDVLSTIRKENYEKLDKIELLWLSSFDTEELSAFPSFNNLKSLILAEASGNIQEMDFASKFGKIEQLTLAENNLQNLSFLKSLSRIKRLSLVDCDQLKDVSDLKSLHALEHLSMLECDSVTGLESIVDFPVLKSLAFPNNMSGTQMSEILSKHPDLQVVQIVTEFPVEDLSFLSKLSSLKALSLSTGSKDLSPLYNLKNLKVLVIDNEEWDELETEIAKLEKALPGLKVVPGGGFCLGSGWILSLIPLFLAFRFLFHVKKRKPVQIEH